MTDICTIAARRRGLSELGLALSLALSLGSAPVWAQMSAAGTAGKAPARSGDYILAVVGGELVTAAELDQAVERARYAAAQSQSALPPLPELRKQALDSLIDERVLINHAKRNYNLRIDEGEVDRAVANVASQNRLTPEQLKERIEQEGMPFKAYRDQLRDQLMVDRIRDIEVRRTIQVSEAEVDDYIEKKLNEARDAAQLNVAQILISVPEKATPAERAARQQRAEDILRRAQAGEPFEALAKQFSDDKTTASQGGALGLRSPDKLPDLFVSASRQLKVGQRADTLLRSAAGFHVLKLLERQQSSAFAYTQTKARHILLVPNEKTNPEELAGRMAALRQQIQSGATTFEKAAQAVSMDGTAAQGGDLGWTSPGTFVPEFEEPMNRLPLMAISDPILSRFGVHLIQVTERRTVEPETRQVREQAKGLLREQRFAEANSNWVKDLRAQALVEMRESPQ
jgi:peptidyl-prolyl cis-trans isomerase SurA